MNMNALFQVISDGDDEYQAPRMVHGEQPPALGDRGEWIKEHARAVMDVARFRDDTPFGGELMAGSAT